MLHASRIDPVSPRRGETSHGQGPSTRPDSSLCAPRRIKDPPLGLADCPDVIVAACFNQLENEPLAQLTRHLHQVCRGHAVSEKAKRLRASANEVCRARVRTQEGIGLCPKDTFAMFGHSWPKDGSLAWASCLFDREHARQNVVIRHEELVQTNGVYAYFGKKLDPVAGSRAVGINNTMMMMAHQVLVEAYERHDTIVWTKDARAAQALWRATSRTPPWAMAAAKTALFYFSHLPEADRATAMGQLVYGTALSYLGEPKRAMGAYTAARRADSARADLLFVERLLPMYFDIMPFRPTHPGHCSVHYDGLELKLELVKHATLMSGSADMLRFCEAWRLAEQRHGRWHVKAAFTGDDCDKFMFEGKHAALRAYVSLRSKNLQAGVWVRRTLRVLRTWQAERADPAEWAILGQEGRRWQRQMSAVQSLLEPLETDEDESDDEP